jgi:hypothetical protein
VGRRPASGGAAVNLLLGESPGRASESQRPNMREPISHRDCPPHHDSPPGPCSRFSIPNSSFLPPTPESASSNSRRATATPVSPSPRYRLASGCSRSPAPSLARCSPPEHLAVAAGTPWPLLPAASCQLMAGGAPCWLAAICCCRVLPASVVKRRGRTAGYGGHGRGWWWRAGVRR